VPMIGQGAVAIECRADDSTIAEVLGAIDHPATRHAVEIEREWLMAVGAGCTAPVGAHYVDGELHTFLDGPNGIVRHVRRLVDRAVARTAGRADVQAAGL
jgi:hydroxymethylbilane synthase